MWPVRDLVVYRHADLDGCLSVLYRGRCDHEYASVCTVKLQASVTLAWLCVPTAIIGWGEGCCRVYSVAIGKLGWPVPNHSCNLERESGIYREIPTVVCLRWRSNSFCLQMWRSNIEHCDVTVCDYAWYTLAVIVLLLYWLYTVFLYVALHIHTHISIYIVQFEWDGWVLIHFIQCRGRVLYILYIQTGIFLAFEKTCWLLNCLYKYHVTVKSNTCMKFERCYI